MALAIGIKVDHRQVTEARREVDVFNKSLTDVQQHSNIDLGLGEQGDLNETAALLTRIREEVSRMGELSRTATNRGGLLRKEQFVEAGDLAKRVQTDLGKWTSEIDKARESLKKLLAEKSNIGRDFMMGRVAPDQMQARMEREAAIEGEEKAARERLAYMEKQQAKLQPLQDRARQYSGVLANAGTDPEQQGTSMKKALGWALAAAGGFSVMSFLSQSRGKYQEYVGHEDQLYARGVRNISAGGGAAAAYGVDPMEHYALQEQLTRSMGLSGKRLGRMGYNTEMFAKAYGMNTSEVGGFGASLYQTTGSQNLPASTLIAMQQQGIEKTRMPETMKLVEGHLRVMAEARKGAGLTEGSVATALALATAAMREKNPEMAAYLKSGNLTNTLQNGLQGAGSPAGEIAIANAVGMFSGPMTYKKIHEMNMLRQGGFMERPDLMKKLLADMPPGLDRAGKAGWLETKFPEWAKGKTSEQLLTLFDPETGALNGMHKGKLGGNESEALAAMLKQVKDNPAFSKQVRQALKTQLKAQVGEGIDAIVSPIETTALEGSESILNSDFVNTVFKGNEKKIVKEKLSRESTKLPYYKEMLAASKKHGVAVELLLAVAKQESGFDANAVSPKGAMGVMQLMPATAKMLGVKNPMNAGENIDGAAKHLAYLGKKYKWNMQAMLGAYNEGETKYDKYGIAGGGEETRNYVANVRGDFLKRTGRDRLPEDETVGQRLSSDMSGMVSLSFEAVKGLLERIAKALEHPANGQAQPLPINH
jgi:soluble lytic murein transglycosylase-like protein